MNSRAWFAALVSTLSLVPLAGVLMTDAEAREGEIKPIPTIRETNLRKAPTTDSQILALIPRGTTVGLGIAATDGAGFPGMDNTVTPSDETSAPQARCDGRIPQSPAGRVTTMVHGKRPRRLLRRMKNATLITA
jgi:hypothetical protein